MNSKKTHKLSKATVATVLAASGVVIALPHPTQAYMFSDLNPQADYYQAIVDLYNKRRWRKKEPVERANWSGS